MHSRKQERWKRPISLVNRWDVPVPELGNGAKNLLTVFQRKTLQTICSFCAEWSGREKWCWNWISSWLPDQLIGKALMLGNVSSANQLLRATMQASNLGHMINIQGAWGGWDHQIAWFSWSYPYHQIFRLHKHISWFNKFCDRWNQWTLCASTHAEFRSRTWWRKECPRDV